ncbi:unnamed protein product, partial [Nesidiocoris tenuis]
MGSGRYGSARRSVCVVDGPRRGIYTLRRAAPAAEREHAHSRPLSGGRAVDKKNPRADLHSDAFVTGSNTARLFDTDNNAPVADNL